MHFNYNIMIVIVVEIPVYLGYRAKRMEAGRGDSLWSIWLSPSFSFHLALLISFGVLLQEISFWTHLDEIPDGSMAVNLLSNFTTCNLSHNMKVLYTK